MGHSTGLAVDPWLQVRQLNVVVRCTSRRAGRARRAPGSGWTPRPPAVLLGRSRCGGSVFDLASRDLKVDLRALRRVRRRVRRAQRRERGARTRQGCATAAFRAPERPPRRGAHRDVLARVGFVPSYGPRQRGVGVRDDRRRRVRDLRGRRGRGRRAARPHEPARAHHDGARLHEGRRRGARALPLAAVEEAVTQRVGD